MQVKTPPPLPEVAIEEEQLAEALAAAFEQARMKRLCLDLHFSTYLNFHDNEWRQRFQIATRARPTRRDYASAIDQALAHLAEQTADSEPVAESCDPQAIAHLFFQLMEKGAGVTFEADFRKSKGKAFSCRIYGNSYLEGLGSGKKTGNSAEATIHEAAFLAGIPLG